MQSSTLCVGGTRSTLCVGSTEEPQSGKSGIPTQSVGTRGPASQPKMEMKVTTLETSDMHQLDLPGRHPGFRQIIVAIVFFGIAFAFVEAAVVVYLRALYEPVRQRFHPGIAEGDLFPLIRLDQFESAGSETGRHLRIELIREAATLVMLAAVGMAVARNVRQGIAAFLVAFGVWDIAFYGFLKLLVDWPESIWTWDLLFLIPVPWVAPVIAPIGVAASMIVTGTLLLSREHRGMPLRLSAPDWIAVVTGGLIIVVAFCWDYRNVMAGGEPNAFHWPLFCGGLMVGLAGFFHAERSSRPACAHPHAVTATVG